MVAPARPVFAIFQGGGAKGVAHIGALEALERNHLQVIGAAGTSAGALVAALASVGLKARRIMNPKDKTRNLLALRKLNPPQLLGLPNWRAFLLLLDTYRCAAQVLAGAGVLPLMLTARRTVDTVRGIMLRHGHFSTEPIADLVNGVLQERLAEIYEAAGCDDAIPERVTFAHLDYDRFKDLVWPLKIVATDVTQGRMVVFDRVDTPQVEVAEAVAASIAIPLVFEPVRIKSYDDGASVFVDGGLVSNLPVWVFQEDKLAVERRNPLWPPVPIIGFSLEADAPDETARRGSCRWLPRTRPSAFELHLRGVVRASLEGSQSLSQRFVEDLVLVPLKTSLKMLDFDADWPALQSAYRDGKRCADRRLRHALIAKPDRVRAELKRIEALVRKEMNARRQAIGQPLLEPMRANLVKPYGQRMFRVAHSYNMDLDADDRLPLDPDARGAPYAFKVRTLVLARIGASVARGRVMTKYEQALVRQNVNTVICVPVFASESAWRPLTDRKAKNKRRKERPKPAGVFCLDSDQDLSDDFNDPQIQRLLATESTLLFPVLKPE